MKLKKALSVANIQNQKVERVPFTGRFYDAFKQPQNRGVTFVWGSSSSGKSSFVMQLAKAYAEFDKVLYDTLEEETDDSDFIERVQLFEMQDVAGNFQAQRYELHELMEYSQKQRSAKTIIIDSGVYCFKNFDEYMEFKRANKTKNIIITGHAQGNNPRSELEKSIMYDAKQKIYVSGFLATCKGRTIGPNGGQFIIWDEGYQRLNGTNSD